MLIKVWLLQDWGPHKAGASIDVDVERAAKLLGDGIVSMDEPPSTRARRVAKA